MVNIEGTAAQKIADADTDNEERWGGGQYGHYADVSRDASRIAYSTCKSRYYDHNVVGGRFNLGYEIAAVNTDGSDWQRLTNNVHFENYPVWSPDGTRIAFIAHNDYRPQEEEDGFFWPQPEHYDTYNSEIFIRLGDGSGEKVVPNTKGVGLYPPVWSPDGERLVFTAHEGQRARYNERALLDRILYMVMVDGSLLSRLGRATTLPTWSPDGERLAFGLEDAVYTVRLDGTDRLLVVDDFQANQVSWSPDGAELLLASDGGVHVVGADGTGLRALGPSDLRVKSAVWSPDGSMIAARHSSQASETLVFIMNRAGTEVRFLGEAFLTGDEFRIRPGLCSTGVVVPQPHQNPGLVTDCVVLLALWHAFAQGEKLDWNLERPIAGWPGVDAYGDPPRVRTLVLENSGLRGPIPKDIVRLTELELLDLSRNDLSDRIPQELSKLAALEILDLSHNNLTGRIPQNLGRLTMLKELDLSNNWLSGPISAGLGGLAMLESLDLSANDLSGSIPRELGKLAALNSLRLDDNNLSGCVPVEFPDLWVEASALERCGP